MLAWTCFLLVMFLWIYLVPHLWLMLRIVYAVLRYGLHEDRRSDKLFFVILVPAHNEGASILPTLASLQQLDYPRERFEILVVADNCSDQTASIARSTGVSVMERQDESRKGKGYALAFAIDQLKQRGSPPDALVVIDADTRIDTHLLQSFAGVMEQGHDWLQAYYTVANADDSRRTQLLTYAFALFNGIWLLGQDRLGLGAALRGNGMGFSWKGLSRCPWNAHGLAEDLEFTWELRLKGEKVRFLADARVYGDMIDGRPDAERQQRLRWEHGRKTVGALFRDRIPNVSASLYHRWLLAADLTMPPLSRYVAKWGLTLLLSGVFWWLEPTRGQLAILLLAGLHTLALLSLGLYLLSPFVVLKLPLRYAGALLVAPAYMAWKARLIFRRAPQTWVRTDRRKASP